MNINVIKFFEKYESNPELRARIQYNIDTYPGSLEIRDALAEYALLPVAEELGLPFTLVDLKVYEATRFNSRHKDVELSEDDMALEDDEFEYWLENKGWTNDESRFCGDAEK